MNPSHCLNCNANIALLVKLPTTTVMGGTSFNPVIACTNCGSLMVRIGGAAGALGWLTHVPNGPMVMD